MALWTCICFYITICRISRANHFVPSKREIWCQVGIMTYNTFTNTYINIYTGYSMDACRGYLKKWRVFFLFRFKMSSSHFILCFWHLYLFGFVMRCSDNVLTLLLDVERQRQEVALLIGSMIWMIPLVESTTRIAHGPRGIGSWRTLNLACCTTDTWSAFLIISAKLFPYNSAKLVQTIKQPQK